ncbi:unnamed protein product [Rotaria socialis]|nr:unnamed protein product [Rotaria socialis]CAF3639538.1 unnamed protein product [Rotaria socialis]CAF3717011.1 unnamed protein product [Rotaria socialis]CAF4412465.1 unnamed protein product [Rotaria socialis]CAF4656936.1 unnamed protein product [Rotaria socialis]
MPSNWINGVWTGVGYQQEGVTWTIRLTADENNNEFRIQYPSLGGSDGIWKLLEKDSSADRYTFHEVNTQPGGITRDGGKIILTKVSDNLMSYSYFRPPQFDTVTSWSTLKRE